MKLNGFIWGALACTLLMPACSNDDDITGAAATDETSDGTLYMNVKIMNASDLTRATDYEYGTPAEQAVSNGNFYFYDQFGNYMTNALSWTGTVSGNLSGTNPDNYPVGEGGVATDGNTKNVEFNSETIVSLAAKQNSYPTYVVTVLNVPNNAKIPSTLNDWKTDMCGADNSFKGIRTKDKPYNFIMSTSSYEATDMTDSEKSNGWFFVTKLTSDNFFKTEDEAKNAEDGKKVNIYVERLAAKVRVTISGLSPVSGQTNVYALGEQGTTEVDVQGAETGKERIYIKLLGWGVSATTKDSRLVKNIKSTADWTNTASSLNFKWNDPDNHRSYWGMSYNYGEGTQNSGVEYPSLYEKPTETVKGYTQKGGYLTYLASGQLVHGFTADSEYGNIAYCPENTNTADILQKHMPSAATFVVIKAQAVHEDGTPFENLVRYNNVVYTEENFKSFALASLYTAGLAQVKYTDEQGKDALRQLKASEIEVVDNSYLNGRVDVQLTSDAESLSFSNGGETTVTAEEVNKTLASFTLNNTANKYKNGLMYYYVVVRHIKGANNLDKTPATAEITEGFYGVVRNHCYDIVINKLANLGYGITNAGKPGNNGDEEPNDPDDPGNNSDPDNEDEDDYPGEPIIPVDEDLDAYFIGANINILSWRTVSQTVAL
jgi:hypothetical protein